ncbi:N-acetylmuramoyl-L-alanine amidase family protein [Haloferula rosea]|uniref:N-acetylmuramoyl-L-alanine amidase n=1 Tax=Haloferula rosea TaxID=490093 RepID=A0A934RHH6_9BACT|nr:N-acetylmuramoyl-L-alanine amidase [Haloferula rosea]MBK1828621.1 N-acetylmuramoyl-L-alanine amidase [Haloferula rosea]
MKVILRAVILLAAISLTVAQAKSFRTVVIDPGHGGHDKGGQWGLVYEKHLALDTSARLENELKKRGFRTVMTRRSDYFISLPERVRIAKKYRDAIFVSIHYNYTWKQHVQGLETFYTSSQSRALASLIQSGMMRKVRTNNRGAKYARYYVIRNATCPAVLVECGFVSNRHERARMKSAWWRQALAEGIADGIVKFKKL